MSYIHKLLGQTITWSEPDRKVWDGEDDGMRIIPGAIRTGVVWSHGPVTDTAWVIPDHRWPGEGHAVCVAVFRNGRHKARKVDMERSTEVVHYVGLDCLRLRLPLPIALGRDENGLALMGYGVERGA